MSPISFQFHHSLRMRLFTSDHEFPDLAMVGKKIRPKNKIENLIFSTRYCAKDENECCILGDNRD